MENQLQTHLYCDGKGFEIYSEFAKFTEENSIKMDFIKLSMNHLHLNIIFKNLEEISIIFKELIKIKSISEGVKIYKFYFLEKFV